MDQRAGLLPDRYRDGAKSGLNPRPRLEALDQVRGLALIAMTVYHFVFDLEMFGYLPAGMAMSPPWRAFAMAIAGSFLILSGISMVLAHGQARRPAAFWRRFGLIAGAACVVSAATYAAFGPSFVFWGILHMMAAASVIGFVVVHWPAMALVALSAVTLALGLWLRIAGFDPFPPLWVTGLQALRPVTVDYLPIFPWLAPYLLGMAWARMAGARAVPQAPLGARMGWLGALGRHSLIYYLAHQPVLIGGLMVWSWAMGRL